MADETPTPDTETLETTQVEDAAERDPAAADAVKAQSLTERGVLQEEADADLNAALKDFRKKVREGGYDFEGVDEDFPEKDPVFKEIYEGLRAILTANMIKAPKKLTKAWMAEACTFIASEIGYWNGHSGSMTSADVKVALKALAEGTPGKAGPGPGDFEKWIETSTLVSEYRNWRTQQQGAEVAEKLAPDKKSLTDAIAKFKTDYPTLVTLGRVVADLKPAEEHLQAANTPDLLATSRDEVGVVGDLLKQIKPIHDEALSLENRLAVVSADIVPPALLQKVRDLRAKVEADDGGDLPELERQLNAPELKKEIADVEAKAKKAIETADAAANKPEEEDVPTIDWFRGLVDKMPDGPLKTTLAKFLGTVTTAVVAMAGWPLIGDKVRGGFISNTMLAEKGDKKAIVAIAVEGEFTKFGLSHRLANDLGNMKTDAVLTAIKEEPEDISKDPKVLEKLAWLGQQIENQGGAKCERSLFDFMNPNGSDWGKGIPVKYKKVDATVVANPPPAPPVAPNLPPPLVASAGRTAAPSQTAQG
jgi:hypothetical protein